MLNFVKKIVLFLLIFAIPTIYSGCSDDPVSPDEGDHFEAVGLVLTQSGIEEVRYENGVVTGEIEVDEGELTTLYSIEFIDEDGNLGVPTGEHHSLAWEIGDTNIVQIIQHVEDGKWRFHFQGKEHGETEVTFSILHDDHADFVSAPIPVHVHEHEGEEHEAVGLFMVKETNGDTLVTVNGATVTGKISVTNGGETGHIAVTFLADDGDTFTPPAEHHSLSFVVADTSIAAIEQHAGEPFSFEVVGKKVGSTTFKVRLLHDDHADYESPDVEIDVTQ